MNLQTDQRNKTELQKYLTELQFTDVWQEQRQCIGERAAFTTQAGATRYHHPKINLDTNLILSTKLTGNESQTLTINCKTIKLLTEKKI